LNVFENTKLQLYDTKKYESICGMFEKHFDFDKFHDCFLT